jgi:ribonuclease VapC
MMRTVSEVWVLDTSALFTLKEDEPGADVVETILREDGGKGRVHICFMSLMEYYYLLLRSQGRDKADHAYLMLKQLPLTVVESDEALGLAAARIKVEAPLSVADAWVAATAERLGAVLVHKDPEYEPLKPPLRLLALPYKRA